MFIRPAGYCVFRNRIYTKPVTEPKYIIDTLRENTSKVAKKQTNTHAQILQ